jgi:hypothetical protein
MIQPEETKTCNKCFRVLPVNCFARNSGAKHLRSECKKCSNELRAISRSLRRATKEPNKDYICPICGSNNEQSKGKGNNQNGSWVLDHDHKTKEFRGWLCHKCNRALGAFNDDYKILLKAVDYLKGEINSGQECFDSLIPKV